MALAALETKRAVTKTRLQLGHIFDEGVSVQVVVGYIVEERRSRYFETIE